MPSVIRDVLAGTWPPRGPQRPQTAGAATPMDARPWIRVSSSNVWGIRYHPDQRILEVGFRVSETDGTLASRYYYYAASAILYRQMLDSPSKGRFVWRRLRGKMPYHRVA